MQTRDFYSCGQFCSGCFLWHFRYLAYYFWRCVRLPSQEGQIMVLLNLYVMFFSIGIFGFGGGYAMLPLIFQRVQEFGQMSAQEFSDLVALSQVTPGPVSVNAATYVGYNLSLIHISEPTRLGMISYAVFCLKKKKQRKHQNNKLLIQLNKKIKKNTNKKII